MNKTIDFMEKLQDKQEKKEIEELSYMTNISTKDLTTIFNIIKEKTDKIDKDNIKKAIVHEELAKDYAGEIDRLSEMNNILSYQNMLFVDFLDLLQSNHDNIYEQFEDYVNIVRKNPQITNDKDFTKAVSQLDFYMFDGFFFNEYTSEDRTDGLDTFFSRNDFTEVNSQLDEDAHEQI